MATARHMTTQVQHHQPQRQPQGSRTRSGFISVPKADNSNGMRSVPSNNDAEHLTKTGKPDRRFGPNRALSPEDVEINPNYRPAARGEEIDGIHYTIDGKVDRRFMKERTLSDEEVAELELQYLEMKAGRKQPSH